MEAFDFSKAKVLTEASYQIPLEMSIVNTILELEAQVRDLEFRAENSAENHELGHIKYELGSLTEQISALEEGLDEQSKLDLARLRSPSGGV